MDDQKIIQSYVLNKWFVSTIERDSSVECSGPLPRFYETFVWRWDPESRQRREKIYEAEGYRVHNKICLALIEDGEEGLKDLTT